MQVTDPSAPRVLAVLVSHDGAAWLPRVLDALDAQTYGAIDVVAVDNASSDGARELLLDRLGVERVLVAERDLGFGGAVSMALDAVPAAMAPYVLLVHDDLVLAPDAVERLVAAMEADPRLAIAGVKLRHWDAAGQLQSVGWTIDLTGRADDGVDEGELDQGQRDQEGRVLYVSTAGMLVRRDVFDGLGRFDHRFHLFRDDLDLCWRAWLAGHDVEVVPAAVGQHVGAAANYVRLGQTRFIGPRYFAERNTLAALLKNYGAARLGLVVALYLVVGLAKVSGFLLTRRVSDAWQTLRAWAWNLLHLRETWRLRRQVQQVRARSDAEVAELFGRIAPRVRAYAEAVATWIAGAEPATSTPEMLPEPTGAPPEQQGAARRVVDGIRRRPVLVTFAALLVVLLVGAAPLLLPGELRGGELAPWPGDPAVFLTDHGAGWHEAGAFGTAQAPSPAQALLGLLHWLVGGSAYAASRLLLLAPVVVGWLLALRAAKPYSRWRAPRIAAATAYVLSPPVLAALATGRVGALVLVAVLPGLVAAGTALGRRRTRPEQAWRGVAAVALLAAVGGAFEPLLLVAVVAAGIVVIATSLALGSDLSWQRAIVGRVFVATVAPLVLLAPWSLQLLRPEGPLRGVVGETAGGELWRWVLLAPELPGFPGIVAGAGFVLAGLLGLVLGAARAPRVALTLWATALAGAVAAWWLDRSGAAGWAALPLLVTAGTYAGLLALAVAMARRQLARHAFGWRQVTTLVAGLAVALSVGSVAVELVRGPWDAYAVDDPALPAFVSAAAEEAPHDPFRVLVLADQGGRVSYEVVPGSGPTMAAYGVPVEPGADALVAAAVSDIITGRDLTAAGRLGLLNVRYVVVPEGGDSPALATALRAQLGLDPRPVAVGQVQQVVGWLPRAAVLSDGALDRLDRQGELLADGEVVPLTPVGNGAYEGRTRIDGTLLISEVADGGWLIDAGGRSLDVQPAAGLVRVPEVAATTRVVVGHASDTPRSLALTGQLLAVLLVVSLALRPPRFARDADADRLAAPAPEPAVPASPVTAGSRSEVAP